MSNKKDIHYNIQNTLSYGAYINYVIGDRGLGKTWGFTEWSIDDFIKNGKQFFYIRRYASEFKSTKDNMGIKDFFKDQMCREDEKYKGVEFEVCGSDEGGHFKINGEVCGFYAPLSTSHNLRGVPFPLVNKMLFDEFLMIETAHKRYIKNEMVLFNDLIETVFRMRDNVTIMCFANAITWTNVHFLYWNIQPPRNKKRIKVVNDILIEVCENKKYREAKKQTRMGKIHANSGRGYNDYAYGDGFLLDSSNMIKKLSDKTVSMFRIYHGLKEYTVYNDVRQCCIIISSKNDPMCRIEYTTKSTEMRPNTMLLRNRNKNTPYGMVYNEFMSGNVFFENVNIKNEIIEIFM